MIGTEHRTLKNAATAAINFRTAYHSYRLAMRLARGKGVPSGAIPIVADRELYLSAEAKIVEAVKYAHRLWVISKDWPDPIIGRAKRRLIEIRETQRRRRQEAINSSPIPIDFDEIEKYKEDLLKRLLK